MFLVAAIAVSMIGFIYPYPNFQYLIELGFRLPWLWAWGGFDGVHYITIAESGYIADNTQAFFPIYPYLVSKMSLIFGGNALLAGLAVSNVSLLIAVALFWRLLRLDMNSSRAYQTVVLLLVFPTSYYLGAVYSEATFLGLLFGAFLAARRRKWVIAGVLGAVASATRPVGIFLFPALVVEWWQQRATSAQNRVAVGSILLIPLGLLLYMWYLNANFDDPLKFLHAQPAFGASRSDKIILLYQVIWRYLRMLTTVQPWSLLYYRVVQEVSWSMLFLGIILAGFRKSRLSYNIFAIFAFFTPTLTGTFSSMPRYVLVLFPAFIVAANWLGHHRKLRQAWYLVSIGLLIINLSLFLTGRWVA